MRTRPEWLEPEAALAAWVPAEFVLARTDDLVVCISCEWPAHGVPVSRVELEGQLVTDAAARSIQLWPEEGPF